MHNDPSRSSKVVEYDANRKSVWDFLLVLNSNLGPMLLHFRDIRAFVHQKPLCVPHSYSGQNFGCSPWSRSVMLGSAESKYPKLTNREIIFEEFRPMGSQYLKVMGKWTTEGWMNRYCCGNIALCIASHGKIDHKQKKLCIPDVQVHSMSSVLIKCYTKCRHRCKFYYQYLGNVPQYKAINS